MILKESFTYAFKPLQKNLFFRRSLKRYHYSISSVKIILQFIAFLAKKIDLG